jgi:uncharacterized protein YfaS (alpha-2-macroglobulin family)
VGADFTQAWQCLRQLGRLDELDHLRKEVMERHGDNWRLLRDVARSYSQNTHWGYMVAGVFCRGDHRGGGKYVNAIQRDRVHALQLMHRAMNLAEADPAATEVAQSYLEFARLMLHYRGTHQAWRLQYLTDLTKLPDYEPGYGHEYDQRPQGAPADPEGRPIFHRQPESWETANSDGQRWRWLLARAEALNPELKTHVSYTLASFWHQQFGVQTLAAYGGRYRPGRPLEDGQDESGPYEVHTLTDGETIARLAVGVHRFQLPDEFNYIRRFEKIMNSSDNGYAGPAVRALAQIYENRRQYDRALAYWEIYKKHDPPLARQHIDQIAANWGVFESATPQPAGYNPTVEYRFRNGRYVDFTAHRIRVDRLLEDVKAYVRSRPRRLNGQKVNLNNIGWRLVHENQTRYIGERVAAWQLDLDPDTRHWDRRVTVKLPDALKSAGAYLVVAKIQEGNTARIIIWISDTVIVKKPLKERMLYYVADAVTGRPLGAVNVDFFGYRSENIRGTQRYRIRHTHLQRKTDQDGLLILEPDEMPNKMAWLATATTPDGRLAFLGFSNVWYPQYYDQEYNQTKTLIMTDRPVYRPAQTVKFKAWVRHARYDQAETSTFAGQRFTVRIHNPKNEQIYSQTLAADAYGGLHGKFDLPVDTALGVYRISHDRGTVYGGQTFRVEEYKKPEFEVKIEAPAEPVMLGEKIKAVIKANYYFGAPVTEASVTYKVLRTAYDSRWYPSFYWDWFYGPGHWWYAYDYPWYPGWRDWGCLRPAWPWWPTGSRQQPEIVAAGEVPIGEDGTVIIPIDTALAKQVHGNQDHRYTISAEVRDLSRRTIVGQGEVLVARKPFKVYTWVDRGHYRVGDTIHANFKAQTLDRKPVRGKGTLKLLRITYKDNRPLETEVADWNLDTDAQGSADLKIQASRGGQYRLAYTVVDANDHSIEGGYIFTVRGESDDGTQFRFAKIELIPDKREYVPGETVRLQINTDRRGAAVVVFVRPVNGVYLPPKVIPMTGKSALQEIVVSKKDMPNFFVEAFTVYDGKLHSEIREVVVPPEKRVLNVKVTPSQKEFRPGQKARLNVELTDFEGKPFQGSAAITVYDRAVEYVSGGSNVPEIRTFFWKWRRQHHPTQSSSLVRWFDNLLKKNETPMQAIGVFGRLLVPQTSGQEAVFEEGVGKAQMAVRSEMSLAAAPFASMEADAVSGLKKDFESREVGGSQDLVQPTVRTQFADTAYWSANVITDQKGTAEVEFPMPENLTGWKVKVWAMGHGTKVGEGSADIVTRKDLMVRLQAPRFFVETDEVVLSANVHNYLKYKKAVQVMLELEGGCLGLMPDVKATQTVAIDANGEQRVDWRVKVLKEGEAVVRMQALTDEESDAMQKRFPVYVHGMLKQIPQTGVIRPDQTRATMNFKVPASRRVEESRLALRYSPTLAGAMVDALPYLVSYPYGCTEQTLNRFLPTVITQQTLKRMGLDLAAIRQKQTNLNPQETGPDQQPALGWQRYDHNPVFDENTVNAMVTAGVNRLAAMQLSDGGWGWFSGHGERAYPHTTALVVHGLQIARENGVSLPDGLIDKGLQWLTNYQARELEQLKRWEQTKKTGKAHADHLDALIYMVLVGENLESKDMRAYLYRDRNQLAVYAKGMYAMALHHIGDREKLAMILKNIEQYLVQDAENQTAYLDLPNHNYWWYWYGSEYEAQAYYLKLLSRIAPTGETASGLVKYLLNNRKHATYWNSTRDTAVIVEALADYLAASGETQPDLSLDIFFNNNKLKTVQITAENLFTFDNQLVLSGRDIPTGTNNLTLQKSGRGPIYFNAYLDYFTLEDSITREGLEIKVQRHVYRLKEADKKIKAAGSRGQAVDHRVEKYEREPLENFAALTSGDLVEVELVIDSKNDYEYLVFEDMKAAGFEPLEIRSGYTGNEMGAYVEFRDQKVCFFVRQLARGRHSLSYRLRAEIPGQFSALPTRAYAMYAPELKANSDEIKLIISDQQQSRGDE